MTENVKIALLAVVGVAILTGGAVSGCAVANKYNTDRCKASLEKVDEPLVAASIDENCF